MKNSILLLTALTLSFNACVPSSKDIKTRPITIVDSIIVDSTIVDSTKLDSIKPHFDKVE